MSQSFKFIPLSEKLFSALFKMNNEELAKAGVQKVVVDEDTGFPCRISLEDAKKGETLLLLSFHHHDVSSPYRASGPIFIRPNALAASPLVNEIPKMFDYRFLSIRGYDSSGIMLDAEVVTGSDLRKEILRMFENKKIEYLHVHNARPGCFNCSVVRA